MGLLRIAPVMRACSATCGIEEARASEKRQALEVVAAAYPGNRWAALRFPEDRRAGLNIESSSDLARRIEEVLPVRVLPRAAEPRELADFLYVLCGLHRPCLFELREGKCPSDSATPKVEETYVRIALSPLGRFAALQECIFGVEQLGGDQRLVTERPRYGVENPDLRVIVKGLMALLRQARIILLDFAFLLQRPNDAPDEEFFERYGTLPTLWSFLVDPAPPTTTRSTVV